MKVRRKEQAYINLVEQVLSLQLAPGATLDEVALSEQFELSRTPLREVFQRLAGEGYLTIESNRGASVSPMDMTTMRNFFQTAPMIYAAVARLATEQGSPQQIAVLKKVQRHFAKAVKARHAADMAMHNHRFHEQIGEMAASPYLVPSLKRLLIDHTRMGHRFYRTSPTATGEHIDTACEQHESMIIAIQNREAARTVELTLAHWELSRNEMDKYVLPDALPVDDNTLIKEYHR